MKKLCIIIALVAIALGGCAKKERPGITNDRFKMLNAGEFQKLLDANKGKPVILNFFATWCPPCRKEVPEMVEFFKTFQAKGVSLVGASIDEDGAAAIVPFDEVVKFNYPVYVADKDITAQFKVDAVPTTIFFGKDGKVAKEYRGFVDIKELAAITEALLK